METSVAACTRRRRGSTRDRVRRRPTSTARTVPTTSMRTVCVVAGPVRAGADRAGIALDQVPDRGQVDARPDNGQNTARRVLDRRGEEERGLLRDHRVGGVADVRLACGGIEEVLAELHARALI